MKKILCLLICLLMLAGPLAACDKSNSGDGSGQSGTSSSSEAGGESSGSEEEAKEIDYSQHETFTYWLYSATNDYYASYSDNPVTQYLNNKFNVTIEFEQPASGAEADSLSLMFGTGEYTDAIDMSYYTGSIAELYNDGVVVDIGEYLDYMPNFKKLLESNDDFRKTVTNDDGRILTLKSIFEVEELQWGGLVYRRDILETMTGGFVAFPSGNDEPTTIEDWDYMLPLFKAYFEAAGMTDYAPLIIPYNGYFVMGHLTNSFGVNPGYYLDNGTVKFGAAEEGFYNYLVKMKEWYDAGYIYQDFASRANDPFYFPNSDLTFGGAAGAWYGLSSLVGDAMSLPEYGLIVDVQPISSPVDTASGIKEAFPYTWNPSYDAGIAGVAITTACDNIPKLLSVLDYMYSEEGGMMQKNGLTAEQAEGIELYQSAGLSDGTYKLEGNKIVFNPLLTPGGGEMDSEPFLGIRYYAYCMNEYSNDAVREEEINADTVWKRYSDGTSGIGKLPSALSKPADEDKIFADNSTNITDYLNMMAPKFIMGTEELSEESFKAFVEQLNAYGLQDNIRMQQEAYERYLNR